MRKPTILAALSGGGITIVAGFSRRGCGTGGVPRGEPEMQRTAQGGGGARRDVGGEADQNMDGAAAAGLEEWTRCDAMRATID